MPTPRCVCCFWGCMCQGCSLRRMFADPGTTGTCRLSMSVTRNSPSVSAGQYTGMPFFCAQ